MNISKNGINLMYIDLQQFSVDTDILTFTFKKPEDFSIQGALAQIIYETDKLDNIKNNNITLTEDDTNLIVTWRVKESITLTSGKKQVQVIVKNNGKACLSQVFKITVLESLNVDDQITSVGMSYLEYWEQRVNELIKKVEQFEGANFDTFVTDEEMAKALQNYVTTENLTEKIDDFVTDEAIALTLLDYVTTKQIEQNYFDKQQIDQKLNLKADKEKIENLLKEKVGIEQLANTETNIINEINQTEQDVKAQVITTGDEVLAGVKQLLKVIDDTQQSTDTTYSSQKIEQKLSNINIDTSSLATKEELNQKLNTETYNIDKKTFALKEELEEFVDTTQYEEDKATFALKSEVSNFVENETYEQDKQTFALKTDLADKANTSDVTALTEQAKLKQDKTDNSLTTNDKTITGAINELNTKITGNNNVDLSNYYNKATIDLKLDEKLDNATYIEEKNNFALKTDLSNKADISDIPTNVSELTNDSEYLVATDIIGGQGIEYTLQDKTIKTKIDGKTIVFDENGALKSMASGGGDSAVFPNIKPIEIIEEEIASYDSSKSSYFSSYSDLECKNSGYAGGVGAFAIDLSKLRGKGCVLEISSYMSNIQKINDYVYARPQMTAYLTIGDVYNGVQMTRYVNLGSCNTSFKFGSSGQNVAYDYTNNDKKYYVAIPEIYSNPDLKAYVCIVNSSNSRYGSATIHCKAVANTDVNTVFATENFETHYMVKTGQGSGDFLITNNLPLIKYPSNVYNNLAIGANNLTKMGSEDGKYTYYNVVYGNNLLKEKCTELQYSTVVGSNIDDTGTGSYPNYNYLQKASYATYLGYGVQPTDQSSNETAIGYYAKGHGSNTVTLGNTSITGLYCQATAITQSCDPRLKENIEDVDVDTVVDALMQIKVIRAGYRNLEEFKGSNENDKNKLMWDAENISNIPLFSKDVKTYDKYVTPLNDDGTIITKTVQQLKQIPVATTLDAEGNEKTIYEEKLVDVEVAGEKELIKNCKEFTPNQIIQALVVGFQAQQKQINQLKAQIESFK